jgi:hypothetical protein
MVLKVVNQNAAFPLNVLPLGGVPKIVLICHQEKAPSLSAHSGPKCLAALPHGRLVAACCDPAVTNIGRIFIQVNTTEKFPFGPRAIESTDPL